MKNIFIFFSIIYLTSGCSSLTKTQTKAINQYFQTVNSYVYYPEQVNTALAHIKLNRSQLYPNSFTEDSLMMESLVYSLKEFRSELHINDELNSTINEYDHFIKEYFLMIPNGFNAIKILEGTTVTIAGFFGLNRVVSSAFSNINSVKISARKAKKIKAHLINGNIIVKKLNIQVQDYLNNIALVKLKEEDVLLKENYQKFLNNLNSSNDSYSYYSKYNTIFIEHYKLILNTGILADKLLEVTSKIELVQTKLNEIVQRRQKLDSDLDEIQELYILINELNRILGQFETYK